MPFKKELLCRWPAAARLITRPRPFDDDDNDHHDTFQRGQPLLIITRMLPRYADAYFSVFSHIS